MSLPMIKPTELAERLTSVATRLASDVSPGFAFMKMGKDGVWLYGAEDVEVEEGSLWAVNPYSFMEGYIAWHDSEVAGEKMAPMIGSEPVKLSSLPDVPGNGWSRQLAVQLACVSGEDAGTQVVFKTSSRGGLEAIQSLVSKVAARAGEAAEAFVPVGELANTSYKHKKYGKIFKPEFAISEWTTMSEGTFRSGGEEDAAPADKKAAEAETAEQADEGIEDGEFEEMPDEPTPPPAQGRRTRRGGAAKEEPAPQQATAQPGTGRRRRRSMVE